MLISIWTHKADFIHWKTHQDTLIPNSYLKKKMLGAFPLSLFVFLGSPPTHCESMNVALNTWNENTAHKQHVHDIPPDTLFLRINTFLIWHFCQVRATSTSISALTLLLAGLGIPFRYKWNNSSENKAEIFLGVWLWSQMLSWCIIKRWNTLSVRKNVTFAWAVLMGRW